MPTTPTPLRWAQHQFRAGERVAVAVSGGADSVALLMAMATSRAETGLVLSAIHVHHGLRGAEADGDAAFVAELAARLDLPLHMEHADVASLAAGRGQGIEEAARTLRYQAFDQLLASPEVDVVVTAHTLDDQAETVLMKLLRGAWTEGLGGISPVVQRETGERGHLRNGRIVRPLLEVTRAEIVSYLKAMGQPWREDSTNQEQIFTRNRVRHTLLPQMRDFQPRIAEQLAHVAAVARDEEAWWTRELARVLPGLVLPGKPVRGGGRANSTQPGEAAMAMELERLRTLHPALQRRVLRAAVAQLGGALSFEQTETLLTLVTSTEHPSGKRGRVELGTGLVAERTARELRLERLADRAKTIRLTTRIVPVPGTLDAVDYGYRMTASGELPSGAALLLRTPQPGDEVRLPNSRGVKTVKEVLERKGFAAPERAAWPVLAVGSRIVWMRDVEVEGLALLHVSAEPSGHSETQAVPEIVSDAPR